MSAQIAAHGRLAADVLSRITDKGTTMAMGRLAVSLPCHKAESGEVVLWLGLVAFGKQAELLARHGKGELISVSGSMQINQWTGRDGALQIGYQVMADAIISARTVRPGGGNKPAVPTPAPSSSTPAQPVMDHESAHADAARNWEIYQMGADGDAFDQRPPFDDI